MENYPLLKGGDTEGLRSITLAERRRSVFPSYFEKYQEPSKISATLVMHMFTLDVNFCTKKPSSLFQKKKTMQMR